MKIGSKTTLEELATVICTAMQVRGVQAVLVGGAVVSIWSNNVYRSRDLDFITTATHKLTDEVMAELGFRKGRGRHYIHPRTDWLVEFPAGPLALGKERITRWERKETAAGTIHLLGPTECVPPFQEPGESVPLVDFCGSEEWLTISVALCRTAARPSLCSRCGSRMTPTQ